MGTPELLLLKWLNALGKNVVLMEASWLFTDLAPIVFVGLIALYLLFPAGDFPRMRRTVLLAGLAGLLVLMVVGVMDYFGMVDRDRPFVALPDQIELGLVSIRDSSFPSGLTAVATAIAVGMWHAPGNTARWVFTVIAMWAGVSGPMMGMNWPSDIVGSAILGWLAARSIFWVSRPSSPVQKRFPRTREWLERQFFS